MLPPPGTARAAPASPHLLSPAGYDDDVASLRTFSDQDSDSEDDQILQGTRSTLELARHDRTVLEAEDELERLLTKRTPTDGLKRILGVSHDTGSSVRIGKKEKRRRARQRRRAMRRKNAELGGDAERDELMFEMEEGGFADDSSSLLSNSASSDSDSTDLDATGFTQVRIRS
jgi:hypothetical protein